MSQDRAYEQWQRAVEQTRRSMEAEGGLTVVSGFDASIKQLYSYTVGLSAHDHPELLIVGLTPRLAHSALRLAASQAKATEAGLRHGDTVSDILAGTSLCAVSVLDTRRMLPMANALFYEPGIPVSALQLVYADAEGRMPWEPGSSDAHTLLGFEPSTSAPVEAEAETDGTYGDWGF